MSDPYELPELAELRRQEKKDRRANEELKQLFGDELDRELNDLLAQWTDHHGRSLLGEPLSVRGGGQPAWWRERRAIELAALRR